MTWASRRAWLLPYPHLSCYKVDSSTALAQTVPWYPTSHPELSGVPDSISSMIAWQLIVLRPWCFYANPSQRTVVRFVSWSLTFFPSIWVRIIFHLPDSLTSLDRTIAIANWTRRSFARQNENWSRIWSPGQIEPGLEIEPRQLGCCSNACQSCHES